ncbi:MAG: flagellar basal body L-ring protein FlgH [Oligoflexales bacterium]
MSLLSNIFLISMQLLMLVSCFSGVQTIESRVPNLYSRHEGRQVFKDPIKNNSKSKSPEVFVRKKKIKISLPSDEDNSGSLYNLDDRNNQLFVTFNKPDVSDFVHIKIVNQKSLGEDNSPENQEGEDGSNEENELDEDKLIKSMPSLEPFDLKSKGVLKNIKMKVMHRYKNGELLLAFNRKSTSEENSRFIKVSARLPAENLQVTNEITTKQLADVHFVELGEDEAIDKKSSSWEDEYTLRLSGFSEADSKLAAELDMKRRELMDIKEQLANRLKSLGAERRQMAKEREAWIEKNKQADKKVAEVNQKLEEQKQELVQKDTELSAKNQEIEALTRPEDKPENNEAE